MRGSTRAPCAFARVGSAPRDRHRARTQPPISSEDGVSSFHPPPVRHALAHGRDPSIVLAGAPRHEGQRALDAGEEAAGGHRVQRCVDGPARDATRPGIFRVHVSRGRVGASLAFFFPRGTPRGASARRANRPARAPGPRPPPPRPRPRARDPAASHRACATVPAREARAPLAPRPGRIEGSRGAQLTAGSGGIFWVTTRDEPTTVHDPSNKNTLSRSAPGRRNKRSRDAPIRSLIPSLTLTATPFPFALRLALLNSLGRADARRGPDLDRVREGRRVVVLTSLRRGRADGVPSSARAPRTPPTTRHPARDRGGSTPPPEPSRWS